LAGVSAKMCAARLWQSMQSMVRTPSGFCGAPAGTYSAFTFPPARTVIFPIFVRSSSKYSNLTCLFGSACEWMPSYIRVNGFSPPMCTSIALNFGVLSLSRL